MTTKPANHVNIYDFDAEFARPRANGSHGNRHVGVPNMAVGATLMVALNWAGTRPAPTPTNYTSQPPCRGNAMGYYLITTNPIFSHCLARDFATQPIQRGRGNRRQDNNLGKCHTRLHRPYDN
jgi:hypothetical protein